MVRVRTLMFVFLALLVLLALTVTASFLFVGPVSLFTSLGIATAKAGLILWFYMNLRRESVLVRLVAAGSAAWLAILMGFFLAEYLTAGFSHALTQ